MITTELTDYNLHLPSYRSLLNPSVKYDYKTHSFIPQSQNDINSWSRKLKDKDNHNLTFALLKSESKRTSDGIKMKYRSLLEDVSRNILLRMNTISTASNSSTLNESIQPFKSLWASRKNLVDLPLEIANYIFILVDDTPTYKACLYTSKYFYCLSKPLYYSHINLYSTYRVAQFVTYLRCNKQIGQYVKFIDLSKLRPGYDEGLIQEPEEMNANGDESLPLDLDEFNTEEKVWAGWRDWKFKMNPLYTIHANTSLTKITSNGQMSTRSNNSQHSSSIKATLLYFRIKRRKPNHEPIARRVTNYDNSVRGSHPLMSKYLLNYSTSKDLPVGYILHLINLCPNIVSINVGNLSISSDYQIIPKMMHKFQTYDLMNNYSKAMLQQIEAITYSEDSGLNTNSSDYMSSASSILSMSTFSTSVPKYNSLLPPLPQAITDFSYIKIGDGRVYLSDLNLKSINNNCITKVDEHDILNAILRTNMQAKSNNMIHASSLRFIDLSSMTWLHKSFVRDFLSRLIQKQKINVVDVVEFEDEEEINEEDDLNDFEFHSLMKEYKQNMVIDLTDSGMYKLLPWAKKIDLNTYTGCKLAFRIMNGILLDPSDESSRLERIRRGRMGENYVI